MTFNAFNWRETAGSVAAELRTAENTKQINTPRAQNLHQQFFKRLDKGEVASVVGKALGLSSSTTSRLTMRWLARNEGMLTYMTSGGRRLTPAGVAEVERLSAEPSLTLAEIAQRVGVSAESVMPIHSRVWAEWESKHPTAISRPYSRGHMLTAHGRYELGRLCVETGLAPSEIAKRLGCSIKIVYRAVALHREPGRARGPAPVVCDEQRVAALHKAGRSVRAIATAVGTTKAVVERVLRDERKRNA